MKGADKHDVLSRGSDLAELNPKCHINHSIILQISFYIETSNLKHNSCQPYRSKTVILCINSCCVIYFIPIYSSFFHHKVEKTTFFQFFPDSSRCPRRKSKKKPNPDFLPLMYSGHVSELFIIFYNLLE